MEWRLIKKVKASSLKLGMYIHDLNCSWMDHGFIQNTFMVDDESIVKQIMKQGLKEVYIDTEKGADVGNGLSIKEVKLELDSAVARIESKVESKKFHAVEAEFPLAKAIQKEADKVVHEYLEDAKHGKIPELGKAEDVVGQIVDSIYRNKDALEQLGRIRGKDEYTFRHSINVCILMVSFCKSIKIGLDDTKSVGVGALLHDIGKMRVADRILNKNSKLTDEEYIEMKQHVVRGEDLLKQARGITTASIQVAFEHHERVDGTGYPKGLKGDQISRFGQMAAIVDVFDAITADRVYHKGLSCFDGLRKILEWSGHHFNGDLVQKFIRSVGVYPAGTLVKLKSGLLAVVLEQGEASLVKPIIKLVYDTKKERFLKPIKVSMEFPGGKIPDDDAIVSAEKPEKYKINIEDYIDLM
jgi:putative nucleotidyltransferase with HDIG domain